MPVDQPWGPTLMPVQCPVCQAEYPPSVFNAENSSAVRCGQCGLMFTPRPGYSSGIGGGKSEMTHLEARRVAAVPPPPTVIYTKGGAARPPLSDPPPVPAFPLETGRQTLPGAPRELYGGAVGRPVADTTHGWPNGGSVEGPLAPLGPPPPFRPIVPAPKSTPPRAQIAESRPVAEVNDRVLGAVGPPPPYRPIGQTAMSFERGPAPDLEPWRLTALSRILEASRQVGEKPAPVNVDADEEEWALPRPPPEPVVHPEPDEADRAYRVESGFDSGPDDLPVRWPPGFAPPPVAGKQRFFSRVVRRSTPVVAPYGIAPSPSPTGGPIAPPSSGRRRRLIWVAGAAIGIAVLGAGLYVERWKVMWMVPEVGRIAGALGLWRGPSPPAR